MTTAPPLSVVLPAYNESRRLPEALQVLNSYLDERLPGAEVIVADDGSTDGTVALVEEAARRWPRVRLLPLAHGGKGHAVREGMLSARGDARLFCDVDLAVPVQTILPFVEALRDADVVIGSRDLPGARRLGEPRRRRLTGRLFNVAARLLADLPYADTQCGFKAFRAEAAQPLFTAQRVRGLGFDIELLYLARRWGLHVREVPVEWRYGEESKVRFHHGPQALAEVAGVRWRACRGGYGGTR